jgi:tetratricopeptide (TPR) repeat protein
MKSLIAIVSLVMAGTSFAKADNISFHASAPSVVEVGERFRVQYSVNSQDVSHFSYPNFDGFEVIYGPSTSSQSSVQFVNGKMSQSSSLTYTFTMVAQKTGAFTIPAASIQVGDATYKSKSLKIQVVASSGGNQQSQGQSSRNSQTASRPQSSGISSSDLFMTATASRTKVYEQEAILVTYKLYTLVNLTQLDGKLPTLDGFQIQEINLPRTKEFTTESYNGKIYHTVVWTQYVLFPQKSGTLEIPSITYEGVVVQQNRAIDPFEAFFNGNSGLIEVKKKIATPKLTIHVSPLPSKPANFSGAVGSFSVSSSVNTDKVKANDAITLKIRVKGTGNMKLISAPEVNFPKDFETYDAKANDHFSLTHSGLTGTREFEYLAVPRHPGKYTIPAAEFVYFDTGSHTYKTLKTEPYTITVEKGSGSNGSMSSYVNNQQDVKELNQDIRYIKTNSVRQHRQDDNLFGSWKYWGAYLLPLAIFIVVLIVGRKRIQDNANIAKSRGRKANKVAQKRLKTADKLLREKNQAEFYDEVMRALWGYIADKLNIPLATLNKENVNMQLTDKQVDPALIDEFIKALDECEFARYAPGNPNENMESVYERAVNVIEKMENSIRKTPAAKTQGKGMAVVVAFLGLLMSVSATAQTKQQADSLYAKENYKAAVTIYQKLVDKGGVAPELYYNMGNCYYKLDEIAKSILNYERAQLLDPSDGDIKTNLALARGKTADKVTPPSQMFFISWWKELTNMMKISDWMLVAFTTFVLMLAGILVYAFMTIVRYRKIGAYGAMVCLVVSIVANLSALSQYLTIIHRDYAIVMAPAVTVKSSPSGSSTDLFVIHEGTKVEILDSTMKEWREVKLEEGKVGWIHVSDMEVI